VCSTITPLLPLLLLLLTDGWMDSLAVVITDSVKQQTWPGGAAQTKLGQ